MIEKLLAIMFPTLLAIAGIVASIAIIRGERRAASRAKEIGERFSGLLAGPESRNEST